MNLHLFEKSPRAAVKGSSLFLGVLRRGLTKTSLTREGGMVCQLLNHILMTYNPHTFTSIVINYNTTSTPHMDTKNTGPSTILALGGFSHDGGKLQLWHDGNIQNPPTEVDIRGSLFVFPGSQIYHANSSYSGERFSIIWFTYKAALTRKYQRHEIDTLMDLNFNLPQDPHQKHMIPWSLISHTSQVISSPHCPWRQDIIDRPVADANLSTLD